MRAGLTLALAATVWLALAPVAGSHGGGKKGDIRGQSGKADPAEVAALGADHAREHARLQGLERTAQSRWNALEPGERRQRIQAYEQAGKRLNQQIAAQPRDDVGFWDDGRFALPDSAIHASMLPTGKLLIFGRQPLRSDNTRDNLGSAAVFDPRTKTTRRVPPPAIAENLGRPAGIYCAAQALLSDGRVLLIGGNLAYIGPGRPRDSGLRYTFLFDPWTETWELGPRMSAGRWYPSAVKLSSGDILTIGGLNESGQLGPGSQGQVNPQMDLFRPGIDDKAAALTPYPAGYRGTGPGRPNGTGLYPRLFTLPDGNVALAGPGIEDSAILNTKTALDRSKPQGSAWTQLSTSDLAHYGAAATLEPTMKGYGGTWRMLVIGGRYGLPGTQPGQRDVSRLDANPATSPGWRPLDPKEQLQARRYWLNNVLLPDGGMVVVGGGSGFRADAGAEYHITSPAPQQLRQVELRRPGQTTWRLGAAQKEWRTYHSTAALLTDGRVFSGGDDFHEGSNPFAPVPDAVRRDSAEIYWPPYLFNGDGCAPRPSIRSVAAATAPSSSRVPWATLTYGETFGIFTEHAKSRMQATLVAPSAVTHSFDMNQRLVPLKISSRVSGGGLNAKTPAQAAIAPPGWYMLFVVDADGTPSISRWVRLVPSAEAKAIRSGKKPRRVRSVRTKANARKCVNPDGSQVTEQKRTARLSVSRLAIRRGARKLDVRARISSRASGTVKVKLGGSSFPTKISGGRIRVRRTIARSRARAGTGIATLSYRGDDDIRSYSVRLRAARLAARMKVKRLSLTSAGRIKASGTITRRARGGVRVQLHFVQGGKARRVNLRARISGGRWKLSRKLSSTVRSRIAQRTGTLHAYVLFAGYAGRGISGELESRQVLGDR